MVNTRSTDRDAPSQPNTADNIAPIPPVSAAQPTVTITTQTTTAAITAPTSSVAPSNFPGMDDLSRILDSSFQSHASVSSPSFSQLTGQNVPPGPSDPTISLAMREIINSAVGLARMEFEREQNERIQRLVPLIVEATRRAMGTRVSH